MHGITRTEREKQTQWQPQTETQNQQRQAGRSVLLGTTSKFRHRLFSQHFPNIPFTHVSPSINEKEIKVAGVPRHLCNARELTLAIANAKAEALVGQFDGAIVDAINNTKDLPVMITLDQVVVCDGVILEKPSSPEQCRAYLRGYAHHPVQAVCAVVVTVVGPECTRYEGVDVAIQHLEPLPDSIIERLIEKGDVLYCAGGITVEDPLLAPYLGTREGSLESIMGLPIALVDTLLRKAGVDTSTPVP